MTGDSQVIPEHKNPGSEADPCVLSLTWMPKNSPSQDLVKMRIDFRYRVFLQPPLGISFSNVSSYIQMHLKYIFLQLCFFSVCVIHGLGVTRSVSLSSGQEAVCKSGQSQLCVILENLFNLTVSASPLFSWGWHQRTRALCCVKLQTAFGPLGYTRANRRCYR